MGSEPTSPKPQLQEEEEEEGLVNSPNYAYSSSLFEESTNLGNLTLPEAQAQAQDSSSSFEFEAELEDKSSFEDYVLSITSAIGGYEPIKTKQTDSYKAKYFPDPLRKLCTSSSTSSPLNLEFQLGVESLGCLQDLRKLLRWESKSSLKLNFNLTTRNLLYKFKVVEQSLIPMLASVPNFQPDPLGRTGFELLTYLLTPIADWSFENCVAKVLFQERQELQLETVGRLDPEAREVDPDGSGGEWNSEDWEPFGYQDTGVGTELDAMERLELDDAKVDWVTKFQLHNLQLQEYKQTVLHYSWIVEKVVYGLAELIQVDRWEEAEVKHFQVCLQFLDSLLKVAKHDRQLHTQTVKVFQTSLASEFLVMVCNLIEDPKLKLGYPSLLSCLFHLTYSLDLDYLFFRRGLGAVGEGNLELAQSLVNQLNLEKFQWNYRNPIRHSRFGGTNQLGLEPDVHRKGKLHYFHPTHLPLKKGEVPKLPIQTIQQLLQLFPTLPSDGHRKKKQLKVDAIVKLQVNLYSTITTVYHQLLVEGGLVKLLLLSLSKGQWKWIQPQQLGQLFYLLQVTTTYLTHQVQCNQLHLVRQFLPMLSEPNLFHLLLDAIAEFKRNQQIQLIQQSLLTLTGYLNLLFLCGQLPLDQEGNLVELQLIQLVSMRQIHQFIYQHILMKPFHNLFHKSFHPYFTLELVNLVSVCNKVVKWFAKRQGDDQFVAKKKTTKKRKVNPKDQEGKVDLQGRELDIDRDDGEDKFDDYVLNYEKYLRGFATDSVFLVYILYLEDTTQILNTNPSQFLYSEFTRTQVNLHIHNFIALVHPLLVQWNLWHLSLKWSYLHTFFQVQQSCQRVLELKDQEPSLKQLPTQWKWVQELDKLLEFVLQAVLTQVNQDPHTLPKLQPKSWSSPTPTQNHYPTNLDPPPSQSNPTPSGQVYIENQMDPFNPVEPTYQPYPTHHTPPNLLNPNRELHHPEIHLDQKWVPQQLEEVAEPDTFPFQPQPIPIPKGADEELDWESFQNQYTF